MDLALLGIVRNYPDKVRQLLLSADDNEIIDALGEINEANRRAGALKRTYGKELEDGERGEDWVVKIGRVSERSYNAPRILAKFADATGLSMLETIGLLQNEGVIEITFGYKKLLAAAVEHDVTLATAQHEIRPGDDADIGKVWKDDYPSYQRIDRGPA